MALIENAKHLTGMDDIPEGATFDLIVEDDKLVLYTMRKNPHINISSITSLTYEEKEFSVAKKSPISRAIGFGILGWIVCFIFNLVVFVISPLIGFVLGALLGGMSALNASAPEKHIYCTLNYSTNTNGMKSICFMLQNTQKHFIELKEMLAAIELNR
ncbi:MAG: hypothetical protein ACRDDX_10400 [Cellulosilyticaceae bacterium]